MQAQCQVDFVWRNSEAIVFFEKGNILEYFFVFLQWK